MGYSKTHVNKLAYLSLVSLCSYYATDLRYFYSIGLVIYLITMPAHRLAMLQGLFVHKLFEVYFTITINIYVSSTM